MDDNKTAGVNGLENRINQLEGLTEKLRFEVRTQNIEQVKFIIDIMMSRLVDISSISEKIFTEDIHRS